jgi:hypothetical protein
MNKKVQLNKIQIGVFTNNVYDIVGIVLFKRLYGIIINTNYPFVYKKYQKVDLPLYHLPTDINPQFYKK